jgi:hypothetical protein
MGQVSILEKYVFKKRRLGPFIVKKRKKSMLYVFSSETAYI